MHGTSTWKTEFVTFADLIAMLDVCGRLTVTYAQMKHVKIAQASNPDVLAVLISHSKKKDYATVMAGICMSLVIISV